MSKRYRVLFRDISGDREAFKAKLVRLGAPAETIEIMIRKAPIIMKGNMRFAEAKRYADAVEKAGGRVAVQEEGETANQKAPQGNISIAPFENFTMCRHCGLIQQKGEICLRCKSKLNEA